MSRFVVQPGGSISGRHRVPSDKSISHRAVLMAALAKGRSEISDALDGEDVKATMRAAQAIGAELHSEGGGRLSISGVGDKPNKDVGEVDCGNSGTLIRLLCGAAAGWGIGCRLVGDASLSQRPMRRVVAPLAEMGARIETADDGTPPVTVKPNNKLRGTRHTLKVASAQVKSAILLAGIRAEGETTVVEPAPSRDHTERMLPAFGCAVSRQGDSVSLRGESGLTAANISVPADISSAAFLAVAAAITPGSDVVLTEVGVNPTRTGVLEILRRMGAHIEVSPIDAGDDGEPIADIRVRHAGLRGIDIGAELVPSAIDEFPAIFAAAAVAEGDTVLTGAAELRVKESDRIAAMANGLRAIGADAEELEDGIAIRGRPALSGGEADSRGDHRIAMALAVAAMRAEAPVTIRDCANVATSFPSFSVMAAEAGIALTVEE